MKRCSYCGKQYSDVTEVCPVDGQPVEDPHAKPRTEGRDSNSAFPAFNARLVTYGILSDSYRIYLRSDDLAFVQTNANAGPTAKGLELLVALLGPIGALVTLALRARVKAEDKSARSQLEERDLDYLLRSNPKNFTLYIPEIRDAVLKPPAHLPLRGEHAGRLVLHLRGGRRLEIEFPSAEDLKSAKKLLVARLGFTLRTEVGRGENYGQPQQELSAFSPSIKVGGPFEK